MCTCAFTAACYFSCIFWHLFDVFHSPGLKLLVWLSLAGFALFWLFLSFFWFDFFICLPCLVCFYCLLVRFAFFFGLFVFAWFDVLVCPACWSWPSMSVKQHQTNTHLKHDPPPPQITAFMFIDYLNDKMSVLWVVASLWRLPALFLAVLRFVAISHTHITKPNFSRCRHRLSLKILFDDPMHI